MSRQKQDKVPVTLRAVIQRIQRKLEARGEMLKAARSDRVMEQVGKYYVVDTSSNGVIHKDVDVEEFAREVGVIEPWEEVR